MMSVEGDVGRMGKGVWQGHSWTPGLHKTVNHKVDDKSNGTQL